MPACNNSVFERRATRFGSIFRVLNDVLLNKFNSIDYHFVLIRNTRLNVIRNIKGRIVELGDFIEDRI